MKLTAHLRLVARVELLVVVHTSTATYMALLKHWDHFNLMYRQFLPYVRIPLLKLVCNLTPTYLSHFIGYLYIFTVSVDMYKILFLSVFI